DAEAGQVVLDPLDSVAPAATRALERVRAGRPEDRAAPRQDAAHRLDVKRHRVAFERPAPPVAEPDEFKAVFLHALAHDGSDNSVQTGAVAASGEDSHSHGHYLSGREPGMVAGGPSSGKTQAPSGVTGPASGPEPGFSPPVSWPLSLLSWPPAASSALARRASMSTYSWPESFAIACMISSVTARSSFASACWPW